MGIKHCGKRRNCSLRAISPFPTVSSKDLYCRHVKTGPVWEMVKCEFYLVRIVLLENIMQIQIFLLLFKIKISGLLKLNKSNIARLIEWGACLHCIRADLPAMNICILSWRSEIQLDLYDGLEYNPESYLYCGLY